MNLTELQQKINNYITVVSSWVRNVGKLYFSSTPENVTVQLIDGNGNVVNSTLPNVAQFRKSVWDAVLDALGMFVRIYYIDAINGDDSNIGSSASPFKTLKAAVDAVPYGGRANIYLKTDIETQEVGGVKSVVFLHKDIRLKTNQTDVRRKLFIRQYEDGDYSKLYNIYLYQSQLKTYEVDIEVEAPSKTPVSTGYSQRNAILSSEGFNSLYINRGDAQVNEDSDNQSFYLFGDQSYDNGTALMSVVTYNAVFKKDTGAVFRINKCSMNLELGETAYLDTDGNERVFNELVSGIARDADSGNPLNVVSNHNFSS